MNNYAERLVLLFGMIVFSAGDGALHERALLVSYC